MPSPDWFGFADPAVPRNLTPPSGLEAVHADGYSWARQGDRRENTSWISPAQWNRIIAQMRGLLTDVGIDLSDLPLNSPLLMREFIARYAAAKIAELLAGTDVGGYGVMFKNDYDPAADGKVDLAHGGTGVSATDAADLRDKIGITAAIDAAVSAALAAIRDGVSVDWDTLVEIAAGLSERLKIDGSNVGGNAAALRAALGLAYADAAAQQTFREAIGLGGSILQVQSVTKSDVASFASVNTNNFVTFSGLTVAITPKRANSKILVKASVNLSQSAAASVGARLIRDATPIGVGTAVGSRLGVGAGIRTAAAPYSYELPNVGMQALDTPGVTNELIYGVQATAGVDYNVTVYLNRTIDDPDQSYGFRSSSTITVFEIGVED